MSRRTLLLSALVVAIVVLAVAFGLRARSSGDDAAWDGLRSWIPAEPIVEQVAAAWATAWETTDVDSMGALALAPADDLGMRATAFRDDLSLTALRATPGAVAVDGDDATVELDVEADLRALGTWSFSTTVPLVLPDETTLDGWRVAWSSAVLHPLLTDGRRMDVARTLPPRGNLLAADGSPLTGSLVGRVGAVGQGARRGR